MNVRVGARWLTMALIGLTALLLLVPASAGAVTTPFSHVRIHRGTNSDSGTTQLNYCGEGTKWTATGYFCQRATAQSPSGSLWSYTDLQANVSVPTISGVHSFFETGRLNLPVNYTRYSVTCGSANASAEAYTYIFWHVWVYDQTTHQYVSQSNSGYLWLSPTPASCHGGSGTVGQGSPALVGSYNTSAYSSTGATSYDFNSGQHYTFSLFVGCTAIVSASGPNSSATGFCDFHDNPQRNTVTLTSLVIV
jgi:hypothetical protein